MSSLILLRHGQSIWNRENRFTGWKDVDLTEIGVEEARLAGRLLSEHGMLPDVAHTSFLKRAILTTTIALSEAERAWISQDRTWRLNERHYGALAGLDKDETIKQYGYEQVNMWRRSYRERPPMLRDVSEFKNDQRYRDLSDKDIPRTESLYDVETRLLPYWRSCVVPQLLDGKNVLIGAHGNSLRALVRYLEGISEEDVAHLEIETGVPRVYRCDTRGGVLVAGPATILKNT